MSVAQLNSHLIVLQLALNPLDLSSQKTKASVGRSGSIGGRRPPSRPRSISQDVGEDIQKISRLCQPQSARPNIHERQSGDGSADNYENESETSLEKDEKEFEKVISQNGVDSQTPSPIEYNKLVNENIQDINNLNALDKWRKTNKNSNIEETKRLIDNSLSDNKNRINKIKQDIDRKLNDTYKGSHIEHFEELNKIETDRRLSTALRGNNLNLEAIDQILKSISPSSTLSDSTNGEQIDESTTENKKQNKAKRHSFITVESLKEVRGRLRRLSSPIDDYYHQKDEDPDDGIASEDNTSKDKMPVSSSGGVSRVRSYVYGMEAMLGNNRTPIVGTGSLESRTSGKLNTTNRSEDWYNRRKSYGFEQVHNQHDQTSILQRNKIESSTDSGICRSTEIVLVPSSIKSSFTNNKFLSDNNKSDFEQGDINCHKNYINKNGNSTIINVNSDKQLTNNRNKETFSKREEHNELISIWNRRAAFNNTNDKNRSNDNKDTDKQITITIPIVSDDTVTSTRKLYHRQLSENSSVSIEQMNDTELKRHSIAVDESKYVNQDKYPYRRTSLIINDEQVDDENNLQRKTKKVEFCKTEVHFAAESGRVNIVETDEKPPPTNNFRRRRRNSGIINNQTSDDSNNKNGLPLIHFGDTSYEKQLFSVPDHDNIQVDEVSDLYQRDSPIDNIICNSTVTVSSVPISSDIMSSNDIKEISEENQPRGILKNKMIKPRPYLLGDNDEIPSRDTSDDQENTNRWGIKLRPVQRESSPMWRSTVTVQNTAYNFPVTPEIKPDVYNEKNYDSDSAQTEFQKLLTSLHPVRKTSENGFKSHQSMDMRRSSWSVADRVKQVENMKWTENKGYSTKVNFGSGEATVIENVDSNKRDSQTIWPGQDEIHSNGKCLLHFIVA